MKILIVHAHPEPKSFCTAMMEQAVQQFVQEGHTVQVSDLYAMGWNPVASVEDFTCRKNQEYLVYALEQREGVANGTISADIQEELDKLLWCDLLILSFPLYWGSVPAMMKGWIDRVFVSGKVYGGLRFYDRGGLAGRRALLTYTCGGRDAMFSSEGVHGEMDDVLRPILRHTLGYVGFEVLPSFVAYHVPYITEDERRNQLADFRVYLDRLDQHTPLSFPRLEDFDKEMRPLSNATK